MALLKVNRLGSKKNITGALKEGKVLSSEFFSIRYVFNGDGHKEFGISVSSRFFKKAAERNLVRRRLSEIVRKNLFRIKPGLKVLITAKRGVLAKEGRKVEEALLEQLSRARK